MDSSKYICSHLGSEWVSTCLGSQMHPQCILSAFTPVLKGWPLVIRSPEMNVNTEQGLTVQLWSYIMILCVLNLCIFAFYLVIMYWFISQNPASLIVSHHTCRLSWRSSQGRRASRSAPRCLWTPQRRIFSIAPQRALTMCCSEQVCIRKQLGQSQQVTTAYLYSDQSSYRGCSDFS